MTHPTKTCTKCGNTKPLDEFKSDSRKADGKASSCKACNAPVGSLIAQPFVHSELAPYDQARRLLARAKAVDDVKEILDRAVALKKYAERAADRTLEIDATEIRFFAERRLGEMIAAQKQTIGLNAGTRGQLRGRNTFSGEVEKEAPDDSRLRLSDVGITSKLSSHSQKMAAIPEDQFQARIDAWRAEMAAGQSRVTMDLMRIGAEAEQRQARHDLAQTLSDTSAQLTGQRRFPCVYADPAVRRKAGIGNRAYENHYPTMSWDDILALPIKDMVLPDAWLFLWLPRAHVLALHKVRIEVQPWPFGDPHDAEVELPLAWAIARAWGFDDFSTLAVWTKTDEEHPDDHGTGLIFWDQDEILCLFKKGRGLPMPAPADKFGSNHRERSKPLGHSRKPQFYRDMIAKMTGGLPVLELFARADDEFPLPANWETWGNESKHTTGEPPGFSGSQHAEADPDREAGLGGGSPVVSDEEEAA